MISLTFEFNKEALKQHNITENELLVDVRAYAEKNEIEETSFGVFEKDGEDALCLMTTIVTKIIAKKILYIDFLKKLELNVDGEVEDCIEPVVEWQKEKGMR